MNLDGTIDPLAFGTAPDLPWYLVETPQLIRHRAGRFTTYANHIPDYPITQSDLNRASKHDLLILLVKIESWLLDDHNVAVYYPHTYGLDVMPIYSYANPHHTDKRYSYFVWMPIWERRRG